MTRPSETTLQQVGRYRSPASKLDYQGSDFTKYAILIGDKRVGGVEVQCGQTELTVCNVLIQDGKLTGQGIGKAVYALLQGLHPGKTLRSSYHMNRSGSIMTTGLSPQATAMWESFVAKGVAEKVENKDGRFHYVATGALAATLAPELSYATKPAAGRMSPL